MRAAYIDFLCRYSFRLLSYVSVYSVKVVVCCQILPFSFDITYASLYKCHLMSSVTAMFIVSR